MESVFNLKNRLVLYGNLIRLSKQYGTLLLLFPALWSLLIASNGRPPVHILLIFVIGAFLMRSAGCVINDIADRKFDRLVDRTKERPLASGKLKVNEAKPTARRPRNRRPNRQASEKLQTPDKREAEMVDWDA